MQCRYCQFAIILYTVIPVSIGTLKTSPATFSLYECCKHMLTLPPQHKVVNASTSIVFI